MVDACNIGPQGQARRRKMGLMALVAAGVLSGFLIAFQADVWMRLLVFPLFLGGFVSLLQAERKVCVMHAYHKTVEEE